MKRQEIHNKILQLKSAMKEIKSEGGHTDLQKARLNL